METGKKWIYGEQLLKRWGISRLLFIQILEDDFPRYDEDFELVEYDCEFVGHFDLDRYYLDDIIRFEREHPEMFDFTQPDEASPMTAKEKREFGQLRREKGKWDASIGAAVQIGIWCHEQGKVLLRKEVWDKVYSIDPQIPDTTVEKIWNSIPQEYRHAGGWPKGKKRV